MAWRLINWAASLVIALVIIATLAGGYLFYRAMPAYSGVEKLPGLSAEVRVWRDAYGVPHIFASSMDDAARALGYMHASERMFQMDILRRVGQGRMAEIRGGDLLGVDKFVRTLGFYREAESSFSALSPWAQKRLEAYAEGVNAFLASHPLPPEFLLAGDSPEPWKPAELVGHREDRGLSAIPELQDQASARSPRSQTWIGTGKLAVSEREAWRSHHNPADEKRHSRERREHRRRTRRLDRNWRRRVQRVGDRRIADADR